MKKIILILVIVIVAMEGLGWWAYKFSKKESGKNESVDVQAQKSQPEQAVKSLPDKQADKKEENFGNDNTDSGAAFDVAGFPPPSVETVDGKLQRTIHMGVRKWQWDPKVISANYGEKVILIMHNADIAHSINIPDLDVKVEIPEEGAIVEFNVDKRGTFVYSCDIAGHPAMEGKLIIN